MPFIATGGPNVITVAGARQASTGPGTGQPPRGLVILPRVQDVSTGSPGGGGGGFKWANPGCCCGGTPPITIPGCPCATVPSQLFMTSSKPASNNGIFQSATFQYVTTPPPLLAVILLPNAFLSTTSFTDPVLSIGQPAPVKFWYLLDCYFGAYVLTRVYVTTPLGSPFRDAIRATWFVGLPGNTCVPFALTVGSLFPGADTSCVVTIRQ